MFQTICTIEFFSCLGQPLCLYGIPQVDLGVNKSLNIVANGIPKN